LLKELIRKFPIDIILIELSYQAAQFIGAFLAALFPLPYGLDSLFLPFPGSGADLFNKGGFIVLRVVAYFLYRFK